MLKTSITTTLLLFSALIALCWPASAQEQRAFSRAEINKILNDAVKHFNANMTGTRVDETTTIKMMTYDEAVPTIAYFNSSNYFATTRKRKLSEEYVETAKRFNIEKTCTSHFKPLMRVYGLEVLHSFSDSTTGRNLLDVRVTAKDCD